MAIFCHFNTTYAEFWLVAQHDANLLPAIPIAIWLRTILQMLQDFLHWEIGQKIAMIVSLDRWSLNGEKWDRWTSNQLNIDCLEYLSAMCESIAQKSWSPELPIKSNWLHYCNLQLEGRAESWKASSHHVQIFLIVFFPEILLMYHGVVFLSFIFHHPKSFCLGRESKKETWELKQKKNPTTKKPSFENGNGYPFSRKRDFWAMCYASRCKKCRKVFCAIFASLVISQAHKFISILKIMLSDLFQPLLIANHESVIPLDSTHFYRWSTPFSIFSILW